MKPLTSDDIEGIVEQAKNKWETTKKDDPVKILRNGEVCCLEVANSLFFIYEKTVIWKPKVEDADFKVRVIEDDLVPGVKTNEVEIVFSDQKAKAYTGNPFFIDARGNLYFKRIEKNPISFFYCNALGNPGPGLGSNSPC